MDSDRKKKLIKKGPEALADALLELAERVDVADDRVKRLLATPKENITRNKTRLATSKHRRRFISRKESATFARELMMLLEDLKSGVDNPRAGLELVAEFYEADGSVFDTCLNRRSVV